MHFLPFKAPFCSKFFFENATGKIKIVGFVEITPKNPKIGPLKKNFGQFKIYFWKFSTFASLKTKKMHFLPF